MNFSAFLWALRYRCSEKFWVDFTKPAKKNKVEKNIRATNVADEFQTNDGWKNHNLKAAQKSVASVATKR